MRSKTRILLVDDHRLFREGIRAILERYPDFEIVAEASEARQAAETADAVSYDVAIVDVTLPGLSGPALLHELRRRGHREPALPGASMLRSYPRVDTPSRMRSTTRSGSGSSSRKRSSVGNLASRPSAVRTRGRSTTMR